MNVKLKIAATGSGLLLAMQALATPLLVTGFEYSVNPTTVHIANTTPAASANVYAGGFLTEAAGDVFTSWCVDIFQHTYFGQTVNDYLLSDGALALGSDRADALGRLATHAFAAINDSASSGAFQLSVWEIVNETSGNPYNLSAGNFQASNATAGSLALAQGWLNDLSGPSLYTVDVWQSASRQDLAVFQPVTTVPEPGSLTLFGLALLAARLAGGQAAGKTRRQSAQA